MRSKFKWIFTLLLALSMQFSFAQEKTVTGVVSDAAGPLPGVNVVVQGTTRGTQTDIDGRYSIQASAGDVLIYSFVGMADARKTVGASNVINTTLTEGGIELGEVVVTALGITKTADAITSSNQVIRSAELNQAQNPNAIQALTGKVSGVQINTTNTGVNSTTRIVIRGGKSLTADNRALIVIDGVISTATMFSSLDPNSIENVNIMKGAQGAALYGSDGVNGVVIVTTKRGSGRDKFTVTLSSAIDFEDIAFLPERQTRYGAGWNGEYYTYENGGWGPEFNGTMQPVGLPQADGSYIMAPFTSRGSDNIKDFFQTGITMQNRFSLSSGDENSFIYFAAEKQDREFVVADDIFDKKSFLFKAGKKLGKWNVEGNVNYIASNTDQAQSFLYYYLLQSPTNVDVSQFANSGNEGSWSQYIVNPYWTIQNDRNSTRNETFNGIAKIQYELNKNINFVYNANVRQTQVNYQSFSNEYQDPWDIYDMSTASIFRTYNLTQRAVYADFLVNFDYNLTDDITFNANIGNNVQDILEHNVGVGGSNLVIDGLYTIGNLGGDPTLGSTSTYNTQTRQRRYSYFGQVDLGYKDFVFLNLTGRNDWTSVLPSDNNSYFYPSAGISFIPTKAFAGLGDGALNYAKIAANWTKVGRADIAPYATNRLFVSGTGYPFNGVGSFLQSTALTDPNIRPEFYTTTELAINLGFFNDRLTLEGAVYRSVNEDLITRATPSNTSGFTSAILNVGESVTDGFEVELGFTPIRNPGGLTWDNRISYTTFKTVVNKISDQTNSIELSTGYDAAMDNLGVGIFAVEGEEFPTIMGTAYERDEEGRVIINAANGMPLYTTEYQKLGKATPDYIINYNTSFSYKGLRLSAVFDYRTGHQFFSQTMNTVSTFGYLVESAEGGRNGFVYPNSVVTTATEGVYAPNTGTLTGGNSYTSFQEYYSTNFNEVAENFVLDATAFRLRELALSFSLPQNYIDRLNLSNLTFGVNARNVFMITPKENRGYSDPEASVTSGNAQGFAYTGQYPNTKTYGFSVNLTF